MHPATLRAGLWALVLMPTGCASSAVAREAHIARLDVSSRSLLADAAAVRARAEQVATDFERAEADFRSASRLWSESSENFRRAAADFERAAAAYRQVTMVAAALALSGSSGGLCADHLSTAAFRRRLRDAGVDLRGLDVDHVWPRSLGGADNAGNYQLLTSAANRALGARVVEKFMMMPIALLRGIVTSAFDALSCGR